MAQAIFTEAPLKRKLESASEAADCKKPRDCLPGNGVTGNCVENDGNGACNGELSAQLSGEGASKATENYENLLKSDENLARNGDLIRPSTDASGSGSAGLEDSEALGEGEVLEGALEQDDDDDDEQEGDEGEVSEIDTENDSVDEEEEEDAGSDEDEDDSDDEEVEEEEMLSSTGSSLHASKGKSVEEGKGKKKVVDVKGKGLMPADKGKGKAIAEDEDAGGSEDDNAGYLSEDPLDEVDLNNILPTRTRRRSSSTHYDFVEQGDGEDDDEDDSDA